MCIRDSDQIDHINRIHESGEHAQIIVMAPIHERECSQNAAHHFSSAADQDYQYFVTTYKVLQKSGLDNFAQVRRDANALRNEVSGKGTSSPSRPQSLIAA